jgi:hypothetical protein
MLLVRALIFLVVATLMEVSGDAVVRVALRGSGALFPTRIGLFAGGAVLLFAYGNFLNLAPFEFRQVVGLYIATLFIVWQIINTIAFGTYPTVPIMIGGTLIVVGGLIVTFWQT